MPENEMNKVALPAAINKFAEVNAPKYPNKRAVLIPVLMECQKHYGSVSPGVAIAVAELVGVAYPEVESVVSFYTMLLEKPTGKYIIGVCCTWNCGNGGAQKIIEHFKEKYSCGIGDIAGDGMFTMLEVECLADCHNAPSAQFLKIGANFEASWSNNLTVELFDVILEDIAANKPDALRERLVRLEDKPNPPDDKKWVWIVTTNNQYAAWVEGSGEGLVIHDGYGKLAGVKESNPALFAEISTAL